MNVKSIRTQMLIYMLIGVLFLFGFVGFIVNKELGKIPEHMVQQYQEVVNARADEVDKQLEKYLQEVKMISQSTIVQSMNMEEIQKFLPSLVIDGEHRNMTISNVDGEAWTTNDVYIEISDQEQYEKIILGGEKAWISQPFISPFADPDMPIVIISHEVVNQQEIVGLVNIVIEIDFLTDVVDSINLGETGFAWIVDNDGNVVAHPDEEIGIDRHISDHISNNRTNQVSFGTQEQNWFEHQNEQGEEIFTFHNEIDHSNGWNLLLSINTEEVLGGINDVRTNVFLAFAIGISFIGIFSFFYSSSISRPILKLKKVFEEAEAGNSNVVADESVRNELGAAAKSFNTMIHKIRTLTYFDPLTQLYNFNGFLIEIPYKINKLKEHYSYVAIVVVSIDDFKRINSLSGYLEGNDVLRSFSKRLETLIDPNESIGRYFGDEFVILLKDDSTKKLTNRVQELWLKASKEIIINENEYRLKVSIGVAMNETENINVEKMVNQANVAKLQAKKVGGNRFQFYNLEIDETISSEQKIENALYHAISNQELYLVYQPIVDINTNKIVGNEALIRWKHERFFAVPAPQIIAIAEQSGLIVDIGKWVLTEALKQNKRWQTLGYESMFISINISVLQFEQANFVEIVRELIHEIEIAPEFVELEITETTAMTMVYEKLEKMNQLKEMGIKVAIDDFGTGYSSLAYFTKFPISTLKIDRTFVKEIGNDDSAKTVITTIISMAKSMGISTTAEGVEYAEQQEFLKGKLCDKMQGYLISKPVVPEHLEKLLNKRDLPS